MFESLFLNFKLELIEKLPKIHLIFNIHRLGNAIMYNHGSIIKHLVSSYHSSHIAVQNDK